MMLTLLFNGLLLGVTSVTGQTPAPEPVKVPFELLATKHITVMIKINGKGPYRMIFDTGAPVNLLNTRTAKAAGLLSEESARGGFNLFGPLDQSKIKSLQVGNLKAENVPVIVMDHPTVEVVSRILGPIEGIIGFPFFARYEMTLDYQAKQMTFVPNGYEPSDILQLLMTSLMAPEGPSRRVLAPAALWGFSVGKDEDDEKEGVTVKKVLPESPAAKAGLKSGDRLLTLDGRWTDSIRDCYNAAGYVKAKMKAHIRVRREGRELELSITPQTGL